MSPPAMGARIAAAAAQLEGTPFRLGGRDPAGGLDCVGLVVAALAACGHGPVAVPPYAMRRTHLQPFDRLAAAHALRPVVDDLLAGDVLACRVGAAQFHAAIVLDRARLVHAHAGLRRVVAGPMPSDWNIVRHWRLLT